MWDELLDELRARHPNAEAPGSSVLTRLQEAYEAFCRSQAERAAS